MADRQDIVILNKARWIWTGESHPNQYARFCDTFFCRAETAKVTVSVDGNYILYINGAVAVWGQYADYPHYKVCDIVDISKHVKKGRNELCILAWRLGADSQTNVKGEPGLIYEIESGGETAAWSREGVLCAPAPDYAQNERKIITASLGFSFCWDAGKDDGFGSKGYKPQNFSLAVFAANRVLHARPNKKLTAGKTIKARLTDKARRVYDLGKECAGLLHIIFKAAAGVRFAVAFGEYIKKDGNVMRVYDGHDFSVSYIGSGERAEHISYLRRIGCRYLQIIEENGADAVDIISIGVKETPYPLNIIPFEADSPLRQKIYDFSARTLQLCMHEHYEDCPWREQALYTLDSRNQMLCGYYAFGEFEFARSNLLLMSESLMRDGLLPRCFPAGKQLTIPAFSLIHVIQTAEYAEYSGDTEFVKDRLGRLEEIIAAVDGRAGADGLVPRIKGSWNFYEWSDGLNGMLDEITEHTDWDGQCLLYAEEPETDLALNCFLLLAMQKLNEIYRMAGVEKKFNGRIEKLKRAVFDRFYNEADGLFSSFAGRRHYSKLCNSLAVLSGCAFEKAEATAAKIAGGGGMADTTLSMKIFEYDALLSANQDKYAEYILRDIDKDYGYMLENGATSFWETLNGYREYGGAGSLCHGWSTLPIYYYHKLGACKK